MRLATWNINSVRLRIDLVTGFLRDHDIDVLCLQETKTEDQHFPAEALTEAGWPHQVYRGEKSYNGVAIVSRLPLSDGTHMDWAGRTDCRHIWLSSMAGHGCIISMCRQVVMCLTGRKSQIRPQAGFRGGDDGAFHREPATGFYPCR